MVSTNVSTHSFSYKILNLCSPWQFVSGADPPHILVTDPALTY